MVFTTNLNGLFYQLVAGFSASLSAMAASSVFGWFSPILPRLLDPKSDVQITLDEASWLATIPQFGILISSIPAGILADHYGRKAVILIAGPLFFIGWAIVLYFRTIFMLYIARVIQGIGVGIVCSVVPLYLGEIAAPKFRGVVMTMFCNSWWLGHIFEYLLGGLLSVTVFTYVTAFVNVIFMLTFVWQPESPYYYLMKNDLGRSRESLSWLLCTSEDEINAELSRMKQSIDDGKKNKMSWRDLLTNPVNKKSLLILSLIGFVSMFCGLIPLASFSTQTLTEVGDRFFLSPDDVTTAMGVMMLVGSILSSFTFDLFGRVPTFFSSCFLSGICMVIVGTYYLFRGYTNVDLSFVDWIPPTGLIIFSLTSTAGTFPACGIYPSELFDTTTRAAANSFMTILTTILAIFPFKFYLLIENTFGVFVNFYIFAVVCFLGAIISLILFPETKGKSLEQIRNELQKG